MRREDKLVISHGPYAVDLKRITVERQAVRPGTVYWNVHVPAVWFRRKRANYNGPMTTRACIGEISDSVHAESFPEGDPVRIMELVGTHWKRVEGDCRARWDGTNLWSLEDESARQRDLDILRPMLATYPPRVPEGYSGWWVYP